MQAHSTAPPLTYGWQRRQVLHYQDAPLHARNVVLGDRNFAPHALQILAEHQILGGEGGAGRGRADRVRERGSGKGDNVAQSPYFPTVLPSKGCV